MNSIVATDDIFNDLFHNYIFSMDLPDEDARLFYYFRIYYEFEKLDIIKTL
jgi:hypothetical protein